MIDPVLFNDLLTENPDDVLERCHTVYDDRTGSYEVRFWEKPVQVYPGEGRVSCSGKALEGDWAYAGLIVLHYLLSARKIPPANEWVSEKDLPGGSAFFRGPHTLPTHLISQRFGHDIQGFERRCRDMTGKSEGLADAAFSFSLLPGIPAAVLLWQADDMFGADAKLLFDRTISHHLPLDIVYALGVILCRTLSSPGSGRI